MLKVIGTRGVLEIIAMFVMVMAIGMLIAIAAVQHASVSLLYKAFSSQNFITFSYVIDAVLVLIVLLLVLRRRARDNTLLFRALECIVTTFTSFFLFFILFSILLPPSMVASGAIYVYAAAIPLVLVLIKEKYGRLRDFTTIMSSIGVGLVLGFNLPFEYAMIALALVAAYDYIAVFKTNDMMMMVKAFAAQDMSFLVSVSDIEAISSSGMSDAEGVKYIKCLMEDHDLNDPECRRILERGKLPVISQISLGEGDIGLPLMAVVSAYASIGPAMCAVVLMGAVAGIFVTMLMLKRYKHPIPAIPPIFAMIGIFSGVALLVSSSTGWVQSAAALLIMVCGLVMGFDILTILRKMRKAAQKVKHR